MSDERVDKWTLTLDELTYNVCRLGQTEAPFSGAFLYNDKQGDYHCTCCNAVLFHSNTKFDSGCGWPSFDDALPGSIRYLEDRSGAMVRTEIRCSACDSHLGHVFDDGPTQTKKRYCVNSVSLGFDEKESDVL